MSKPPVGPNLNLSPIGDFKLFLIFLKIGATSFGGFMALIAVVQDEVVKKRNLIKDETVMDGISLASVLPGPLAVNVVTFIGYQVKGIKGALLSMTAVILPSFVLVSALSYFYFEYGSITSVEKIFLGILPSIVVIIFSVGFQMAKKAIASPSQYIITLLASFILFFLGGFVTTIVILIASGIFGIFLFPPVERKGSYDNLSKTFSLKVNSIKYRRYVIVSGLVITFLILINGIINRSDFSELIQLKQILMVFSGTSVTLFGGGYIFIPSMQEMIVENLHWVSIKEFTDGIAIGQITPGPIMITATFVGYKVAGFMGALVATIGMFLPPGLLIIFVSGLFDSIKNSEIVNSIFKGIRPAVIGMIFSAAVSLSLTLDWTWQVVLIICISLFLIATFRVGTVPLILGSGILGFFLF